MNRLKSKTSTLLQFQICASARRALSSIFLLTASFVVILSAASLSQAQEVIEHYDGVLGTSLDITVYAPDQSNTANAIETTVAEIARLEQILTTFDEESEVMQLNVTRMTDAASQALIDVISACEDWFTQSEGNFSCRLGGVVDFWDVAEETQQVPSRRDLSPIARNANRAELIINPDQNQISLGDGIKLDPSGLAKGYVIDKAMAVLRRELPNATAIKVDIGGDASYWGIPPDSEGWEVMVANPESTADNADFITSLSLGSKAVATSGHNSRMRQILMREFSHIFTPQTGWPVFSGLYAVVIADDAMTADAVATTLSVLPITEALTIIEALPGIEALLVDDSGAQRSSSGWSDYLSQELLLLSNADFKLTLDYSIPTHGDRGYERPYVAIWVSTMDNQAIKNLILFGGQQRWAGSNSRWWRYAGRRSTVEKINVTRPTRGPGEYQLVWDGRDDSGTLIQPGDYLLHVEASREHGGHSYRNVRFSFTEGIQVLEQEQFGEVGAFKATVEMKPVEE
ncbi:MAG: thiamine biosynthesis protein [SAR86 cluster bacterium]|uniref:FAD:protein FMN transferase n=1 Tax=SAR86 cluster bacterium TaxID=2030880 RepID=A0A2A5C8F0_9GAMM|nr:MAG: thiamine biosynthesis protein [SAR86 cluster bacterium]